METLFIGKSTIFLSETESTNTYAADLLKNVNLPEGTVVQAGVQKAGKGQRGASWQSSEGNSLCASVVLRPVFLPIGSQHYLYKLAALGASLAISDLLADDAEIAIKWPNDVLAGGRKVAGILIENSISEKGIVWSVIGIGINLNQLEFPGLPRAVSLRMLSGKTYAPQSVLQLLCARLEQCYLALKSGKTSWLNAQYRKRFFGLKDTREFIVNNQRRLFTVKGVSKKGLLSLEDESGRMLEADVKEVEWVY